MFMLNKQRNEQEDALYATKPTIQALDRQLVAFKSFVTWNIRFLPKRWSTLKGNKRLTGASLRFGQKDGQIYSPYIPNKEKYKQMTIYMPFFNKDFTFR